MSHFEDQFDDWMNTGCQGNIEDYDGAGNYVPAPPAQRQSKKTKSAKRRDQRKKAKIRAAIAAGKTFQTRKQI